MLCAEKCHDRYLARTALISNGAFMETPVRHKESALRPKVLVRPQPAGEEVAIGLSAAVLAMQGDEPMVAVLPLAGGAHTSDATLPSGRFSPREHANLEEGLRRLVQREIGLELGFAQQLYTFGERGSRHDTITTPVFVSVCYLALLGPDHCHGRNGPEWRSWYDFLPWEDWRRGRPACLTTRIEPRLRAWADQQPGNGGSNGSLDRHQRLRVAFGCDGGSWDEEKVLERYELMCEAGIAGDLADSAGVPDFASKQQPRLRHPLQGDQTRVLASAVGEMRRALKFRPVVFEMMAEVFTLFELQRTVEAILGPHLHKQNFRRLVESGGLVEPTGDYRFRTGGRPAQLYRFRRDVVMERLAPGVRVKAGRA
jgi:hypothetical protein